MSTTPVIIDNTQLELGDIVRRAGDHNSRHCAVRQIKNGYATMFCPYIHLSDFSYTGGVICYTGVEEFKVRIQSADSWILISRKNLK